MEKPPARIVSLVPSLTETVADLGFLDHIVGCTSFCDKPDGLKEKLEQSGGIIGGPKNCDVDGMLSLEPELVLASREENLRATVHYIEEFCPVYVADPKDVNDAVKVVRDLGRILDAQGRADDWIIRIDRALMSVAKLKQQNEPEKFVYLVWWSPMMVAGGDTYISNLLEEGPMRNFFREKMRYPEISPQEIGRGGIDMIFAPTEPFMFGDEEISEIRKWAPDAEVRQIDGRMCAWYGTRTALGLEYLCEGTWKRG
jgi:ABC-type Fe3+-hydroxamate transport system substrate-binding protein